MLARLASRVDSMARVEISLARVTIRIIALLVTWQAIAFEGKYSYSVHAGGGRGVAV